MPRSRCRLFWLAALFAPTALSALPFAEGYSSAETGAPALLYYRAFTLTEGREACDTGPRVTSLRIRMPSTLKVGDRIHRMNGDPSIRMNLVVEARDSNGALVPSVPIVVDVSADASSGAGETFMTRADLDYVEATAPGTFILSAQIYCDYTTLSTRLPLTVEE